MLYVIGTAGETPALPVKAAASRLSENHFLAEVWKPAHRLVLLKVKQGCKMAPLAFSAFARIPAMALAPANALEL